MTARRARIFIDYWNFQLSWNDATARARCDWRQLPAAPVAAAARQWTAVGITDPVELEETLLYASVDPVGEVRLKEWLTGTIERLPSWRVAIRERRPRPKQVHCRACDVVTSACPHCNQPYVAKPEK